MYIAVRADLPKGLQAAQAVHAAFAFSHEHLELFEPWYLQSNFLVIVSVADEYALMGLIEDAHTRGITKSAVREPDIENQITAVAFAPGCEAKRLCANFPLALKEPALV